MTVRFVDEDESGFGWLEQDERMQRASHALAAGGRVWIVDPVEGEGVDQRIRALGEPAGVIQLLDRHERAGAEFAARFGVPLHVVPEEVAGSPFTFLPVASSRWWREVALWWPEQRTLVCADALGTVPYFRSGDEPAGVHPLLRLRPPATLSGLGPEHLLVGHGEGLHGPATAAAVDDALRHARRRFPRWLTRLPRILRAR
jgi:hypothetical protein